MENVDQLRLVLKVARLYHTHGRRQADIAARLHVSQSRVSRLLSQAEEVGIVRTVVALGPKIHTDLEERLENSYEVKEVHVIDAVSSSDDGLTRDLAYAMAAVLEQATVKAATIGFTSWSRTLRTMVGALQPLRTRSERVVELLGDLGPPAAQHKAAHATQMLAGLVEAQPVFLRTPGVVSGPDVRQLLLSRDVYAREALALLDNLDLALIGIGTCDVPPQLGPGDNYFTKEQLEEVQARGAVGQVCLRFLDADGTPIESTLDDLVVGVTVDQLRSAKRRWAVAGGPAKYPAIRAALRGGWVDGLVTDIATAQFLLSKESIADTPRRIAKLPRSRSSLRGHLSAS